MLKAQGISSLVVEQNALAALEIADRVYVMSHGKVVHNGPAEELLCDVPLRRSLIGI
jgi:branched-chain amino acid transport system ATP-binding protein